MASIGQQADRRSGARAYLDPLLSAHAVLSIDEAAAILRVNRKTVVAMIGRGELPDVRYARRRWVPVRALRELVAGDSVRGLVASSSAPMIVAASRSRSGSQCA